jgi:hypothetical protein
MNPTQATDARCAERQETQCVSDLTKQALHAVFRAWRFAGADDVIVHGVRRDREEEYPWEQKASSSE